MPKHTMNNDISWTGFSIRLLFALLLVFGTYNPEGYSFYHWVVAGTANSLPVKIFVGLLLIIGWTIFIRATRNSLGFFGMILALALFASLIWMLTDWGIFKADSPRIITYLVMLVLSLLLAIGLTWSHIRRRITGQLDVDELDDN